MNTIASVALLVCFVALAQGCQHDVAGVAKISHDWEAAANANDWKALSETYTKDAILLPPNSPAVEGRENIKAFFEKFPKITEMSTRNLEIESRGDLAYVRGVYKMTLNIPGMEPIKDEGKFIEIRQKQMDGSWLILRDIVNSDKPAGK